MKDRVRIIDMIKYFCRGLMALAFCLLLAFPAEAEAPAGSTIPHLTLGDFLRTVGTSDIPVLIQFDAHWCPYCHKMQPFLDKIRADKSGKIALYKVDADEELELMRSYAVKTLPTLLMFDHGRVIGRDDGYMPGEKLESWVEDTAGKADKTAKPAEAATPKTKAFETESL